jgi:hypothetical protein
MLTLGARVHTGLAVALVVLGACIAASPAAVPGLQQPDRGARMATLSR